MIFPRHKLILKLSNLRFRPSNFFSKSSLNPSNRSELPWWQTDFLIPLIGTRTKPCSQSSTSSEQQHAKNGRTRRKRGGERAGIAGGENKLKLEEKFDKSVSLSDLWRAMALELSHCWSPGWSVDMTWRPWLYSDELWIAFINKLNLKELARNRFWFIIPYLTFVVFGGCYILWILWIVEAIDNGCDFRKKSGRFEDSHLQVCIFLRRSSEIWRLQWMIHHKLTSSASLVPWGYNRKGGCLGLPWK